MKIQEVTAAMIGNVAAMNGGKVSEGLLTTLNVDYKSDCDVISFLKENGIEVEVSIEAEDTRGLSSDEEMQLVHLAKSGDMDALTDLILAYDPLICNMASEFGNFNSYQDLKSIATECFIKVVKKFDPCKGRRLSPYAKRAIRLAFYDYLHESHMIKLPVYSQRIIDDLNKYAISHNIENGWSDEDIKGAADELDMSVKKVKEFLGKMVFLNISSTEANTKSSADSASSDYDDSSANFKKLGGEGQELIEDAYIRQETTDTLNALLDKLPEDQKEVIEVMYYNETGKNLSTAKAGKLLGIDESDVKKLRYKAFNFLKAELASLGYRSSALC